MLSHNLWQICICLQFFGNSTGSNCNFFFLPFFLCCCWVALFWLLIYLWHQDRNYVTVKSRVLYPEFRGRMVCSGLVTEFLPSVCFFILLTTSLLLNLLLSCLIVDQLYLFVLMFSIFTFFSSYYGKIFGFLFYYLFFVWLYLGVSVSLSPFFWGLRLQFHCRYGDWGSLI